MLTVTSLMVAFVAFDRLAIGYLGPYLVKEFSLSNTSLGALYSVQALAAAVGGYVAGMISDAKGWRKQIVAPCLVLMSICAVASSAARGFTMLLPIRFVMGGIEGPIAAITQSIVSMQSSTHRRGLNMGFLTLVMFLVSQMLSPIILTHLADTWGWRAALLAPAAPALLLAFASAMILKGGATATTAAGSMAGSEPREDMGRNVWVCAAVSMTFMCWLVVHSTFLPLYLVKVRGMAPTQMGFLMSALGVAGCVGGLIYPTLSDRIGRKATMLIAMGCSTLTPLGVLFFHGSAPILAAILSIGWLSVGALPIYSVVIPGESVNPRQAATVIAMIMGAGELVGGVAGPLGAGWAADTLGLTTLFWFTAGAAVLCTGLSMLLLESGWLARRPAT